MLKNRKLNNTSPFPIMTLHTSQKINYLTRISAV